MWFNKFKFSVYLGIAFAIGAPNVLAARPAPATPPAPYVVDANGKAVGPLVPSAFNAAALYRNGTERIKIVFIGVFGGTLDIVNPIRLFYPNSTCTGSEVFILRDDIVFGYLVDSGWPAFKNEYPGYSNALVFKDGDNVVNLGRYDLTIDYADGYPYFYELLPDGNCQLNSSVLGMIIYPLTVEPLTDFQAPFMIK